MLRDVFGLLDPRLVLEFFGTSLDFWIPGWFLGFFGTSFDLLEGENEMICFVYILLSRIRTALKLIVFQ